MKLQLDLTETDDLEQFQVLLKAFQTWHQNSASKVEYFTKGLRWTFEEVDGTIHATSEASDHIQHVQTVRPICPFCGFAYTNKEKCCYTGRLVTDCPECSNKFVMVSTLQGSPLSLVYTTHKDLSWFPSGDPWFPRL